MAAGEVAKTFVRPPFANYDIVVYFGCGLFALPFVRHYYIEPFGLRFPRFDFEIFIPFADVFISTLALLFSVYIVGHMLAFVGGQIIEKTVDMFFGKVSTVVLMTSGATTAERNTMLREQISTRRREVFRTESKIVALGRAFCHLPVIPAYLALMALGIFGIHSGRVPRSVLDLASAKLERVGLKGVAIDAAKPWFKAIEGYVINNYPIATARMYNYLVISGLFRSVCMLLLASLWLELFFFGWRIVTGVSPVENFMTDTSGLAMQLWGYGVLTIVYLFSLFSFLKFQRRYVEDAIVAFALTRDGSEATDGGPAANKD